MRRRLPPLPPLWFALPVTVALALGLRALEQHAAPAPHAPIVQLAFWQFLVSLLGYLWDGSKAVLQAVVEALQWSVKALWAFATATFNGLKALGGLVRDGVRAVWQGLKDLYERVLKPAWQKFWNLFDKVRKWLDKTFGPVFKFLYRVRDELLKIYKKYIRPVLDILDATRGVLRVLEQLHVGFAKRLDAWIAGLEDKIQQPFEYVLGKLNEIINAVNRIATVDGLIQRLALVRSLERDAEYWIRTFWLHQVDRAQLDAAAAATAGEVHHLNPSALGDELALFYGSGGGELAPAIAGSDGNILVAFGVAAAPDESS